MVKINRVKEHHLILGGARSGKSSFAEAQVISKAELNVGSTLHYVATAICFDDEMKERVQHHKNRRGHQWVEHEEPVALADKLSQFGDADVVLVDCLTLWLNNVLYELGEDATNQEVEQEIERVCAVLAKSEAQIFMVSNEVGLGVVPLGKVSRLFVDNAGRMNQAIAKICGQVTLIAAGLPLSLKDETRQVERQ
ncbi:bifunctional adenosylcobinamide kinase/adenosylcobinamide-phosphate guanylyltransferase [Vibrio profundi]|uniref:bifunctional adenosylcobinamide kinase/adenosylcobinamide-phosphate guanylyltransferase n=1 Tax=Vibrio profundi TaxID=1774960 RepID=UPI003734F42A